jgi:hypothetical protein
MEILETQRNKGVDPRVKRLRVWSGLKKKKVFNISNLFSKGLRLKAT